MYYIYSLHYTLCCLEKFGQKIDIDVATDILLRGTLQIVCKIPLLTRALGSR